MKVRFLLYIYASKLRIFLLIFFVHYFESNKWNKEVQLISGEGARNHGLLNLSPLDFFNIKISIPRNDKEQTKIGHFLDLLNEKINTISSKLNTLKKYKEGLTRYLLQDNKSNGYVHLKDIVFYENKSTISAGESIDNGQYILYKSGQKNGFTNTYTHEGIFIIANDGGAAQFKLTNGKFSYTDHCICFRCNDDATTIVLGNYLQLISKKISYVGFTGTGLKNIDRQYLNMIHVPILEYKKIARVFVSIERAISLVEMNQYILKKVKSSMLNSLFI